MVKTLATLSSLALLVLLPASLQAAPNKERRVTKRSTTSILPKVDPVGKLRTREKSASIRVETVADATVEVDFQVFCFDSKLKLHRRTSTLTGIGVVTGRLKRPGGKGLGCSASATVRVTSRTTPASGVVQPAQLTATIRAKR